MALETQQSLTIREGNSFKLTCTLLDDDEVTSLTLASIDTATLTLYDVATKGEAGGGIINSRDGQDVLNTNQVAISDGSLIWSGLAADAKIVGTPAAGDKNTLVALFEINYSSGAKWLRKPVFLYVEQLDKVT